MSDRDIPERLGRYEIVERLSAGGMGEVFVARFVAPGGFVKAVALKRIHPHLAGDEQFINMLHDEANVAAAVKHPNIVSTIDVGHEGDNHYVVLDYVSGEPLSRLVKELKRRNLSMPAWVAAWIGAQTAAALHAAHEARDLQGELLDIVHRDVSLANVMLSDSGHPMLFDFGVAKAKQRIHHTEHGELKGKLAYMAPETFRGAPVDRTVDVFGLGIVIYEMLTKTSPFQRGSDVDTITALTSAIVPPPSTFRPELDRRLDPVVLTAMARDRAARYPTAAHVESALRDWARAAGVPHEAPAVARWIEETFPDRMALRKALLGRVADLSRRPAIAAPSGPVHGGTPAPFTPAIGGVPVAGWGATPSGPFSAPGHAGSDPRMMPVTGPSSSPMISGDPRAIDQITTGGVARRAEPASGLAGKIAGGAIAGLLVLGLGLYLVLGGGAPQATESAAASTAMPSATAVAAAPATSEAPAAAETASAAPSASAKPAQKPGPRAPRAGDAPKGRGPIQRSYD